MIERLTVQQLIAHLLATAQDAARAGVQVDVREYVAA